MNHNLEDWKQIATFVNEVPIIDCTPLKWYNDDGNCLSPDELISLGYWGVRPPVIPSEYNSRINKLEEIELKDCERDIDKRIIIQAYKIVDLTTDELSEIERKKRDILLQTTDKFVYPDIWEDLPQETRDALKSYRKKLRDISLQEGFPNHIDWPILDSLKDNLDLNLDINFNEFQFQPLIVTEDGT